MTWSMRHAVNTTRADRQFMQKCLRLTGGGMFNYCRVASFISKYTNRAQERLVQAATVVSIIEVAQQTNLTNLFRDKKEWPAYMTIGNLQSKIRKRPGLMEILFRVLLPIPPKLQKSSRANKLLRLINADTLRGVFELIFAPWNGPAREGPSIACADGKIWRCFPIMSGQIADHQENVTLHRIKSNACRKREVPPEDLRSRVTHYHARDYARYHRYERQNPFLDSDTHNTAHTHYTNETQGIKRGQSLF